MKKTTTLIIARNFLLIFCLFGNRTLKVAFEMLSNKC